MSDEQSKKCFLDSNLLFFVDIVHGIIIDLTRPDAPAVRIVIVLKRSYGTIASRRLIYCKILGKTLNEARWDNQVVTKRWVLLSPA